MTTTFREIGTGGGGDVCDFIEIGLTKNCGQVDTAVSDFVLVELVQGIFHSINYVEQLSLGEIHLLTQLLLVLVFECPIDKLIVHSDMSGVLIGVDFILLELYLIITNNY